MSRFFKTKQGVSLAEMVIAAAVVMIMLVAVFQLYSYYQREEAAVTLRTGCSARFKLIEERLRRDLASAGSLQSDNPNVLRLFDVLQEDGSSIEQISYEFSDQKREVIRISGADAKHYSFADITRSCHVFNFSTNYLDAAGNQAVAPEKAVFVTLALVTASTDGQKQTFSLRAARRSKFSESVPSSSLIWKD